MSSCTSPTSQQDACVRSSGKHTANAVRSKRDHVGRHVHELLMTQRVAEDAKGIGQCDGLDEVFVEEALRRREVPHAVHGRPRREDTTDRGNGCRRVWEESSSLRWRRVDLCEEVAACQQQGAQ